MGKIIKIKEEDLIPGSVSLEPIYPASISKASWTTYEENYPGSPEIHGEQTIDVDTDLHNLWDAMGPYAIKPETYVKIAYDGLPHGFSLPSSVRYTISPDEEHTEVGTYTYTATLKPGYVWRDMTTDPVTITMEIYQAKLKLKGSSLFTPINKVYDGTATALLVNTGVPTDYTGTITYSTDGVTYVTTIPEGTDAKDYKVYIKCTEDAKYDALETSYTAFITKKPVAYPKITSEIQYTGSEIQAKYLDGTIIPSTGTTEYAVLESSVLTATDVNLDGYQIYFKPRTNYMWDATQDDSTYIVKWYITKGDSKAITWNVSTSYNVGDALPETIATVTGALLAFSLYEGDTYIKAISGGHIFTTDDTDKTYRIKAEYAKEYPNFGPISQEYSTSFTVTIKSNVIEWDPSQITSGMLGSSFTLKAKATSGKIIFRLDSATGPSAGDTPVLVGDYYETTWTPSVAKTYTIYACNSLWDTSKYSQAEAVTKAFSIQGQVQNTITWTRDSSTKYPGDTLTLSSTAVTNATYPDKAGTVNYYLGNFSDIPDDLLPEATPLTSPYTIKSSDIYGLTISAFNIGYDKGYVSCAEKKVYSFNVSSKSGDMTLSSYSKTAYIDTPWEITVTVASGDVDFRLKTSYGWSSMKGDSRATITDLGDNKYKLEYKFLGPSGRVAGVQIHNNVAVGYIEPSNQDTELEIGILSKSNVITMTQPSSSEITVDYNETIDMSAYATSGYVQYWLGNPDDIVTPGTLITEGYNQGAPGEACTLSNYKITKATTYIYMRNIGYTGEYTQASDIKLKVNAKDATTLYLSLVCDSSVQKGNPLAISGTVKDAEGNDYTSEFALKYYVNGTEVTPPYTPTTTGSITVKVAVVDPKAKSGYVVNPSSVLKTVTVKEGDIAWFGYSQTFNDKPTEETVTTKGSVTTGFKNLDTTTSPYNSPKTIWVAVLTPHTATIKNSLGADAFSDPQTLGKYTFYYAMARMGFQSVITCTIS